MTALLYLFSRSLLAKLPIGPRIAAASSELSAYTAVPTPERVSISSRIACGMVPFTMFREKIKSRFLKSFLYYIPYAVLSAMTIPAIFFATGSVISAAVGAAAAMILAYFGLPLIVVALSASAAAYITGLIISLM